MKVNLNNLVGNFYLAGISIQTSYSDVDSPYGITCYGDILLSFQNEKHDNFVLRLAHHPENSRNLNLSHFLYPYKKSTSLEDRKNELTVQREQLELDTFHNHISFSKMYLVRKIDFFGCKSNSEIISIDFFDFHFTNGKTLHFMLDEQTFKYKLMDTINFNWKDKSNYIRTNGIEKEIKLLQSYAINV